jgi:hypothetical protein
MSNKILLPLFFLLVLLLVVLFYSYNSMEQKKGLLELSDYVTIVIQVPETHANIVREAMGKAGAGKIGDYSYCSYSAKGIGRFMPNQGSHPFLGKEGVIEEVVEERIETVCDRSVLAHVLEEIKKAHPYEEAVIDIYSVYEIGRKKAKRVTDKQDRQDGQNMLL